MEVSVNDELSVRHTGPKLRETPQVYLVSAHVRDLLNVRRLQGRLTTRQTAALLNCGEHDIPVLVSHGLIKPLGNPPPNAQKYFSPVEILQLAGDSERMGRICDALYKHWQVKNAAKSGARQKPEVARNGNGHSRH
jgi:hypothetical protein